MAALGYKHHTYDMELAAAYASGDVDVVLKRAAQYESFDDWPWHIAYRDLDAAFPGSKFVVTRRKDTATYVDSLRRHRHRFGQLGEALEPEPSWWSALFPEPYGTLDLEAAASRYEAHYASLDEYFAGREADVLRVCWEEGDGWGALCAFLDLPVPNVPFPHANRGTATHEAAG